MAKVKSTRIGGKRHWIRTERIVGLFHGPEHEPGIYVDGSQPDGEAFSTTIHEWMHARFPDLSERQVEQIERELGGLCLRLFDITKKEGAW